MKISQTVNKDGKHFSMNRYTYLLKNIGLLALSSFATKLMSLFLVPLYTNILTTAEYGTYDLFSATVSLLETVLTFNIQAAVLRFALEKNSNRNAIVTISMKCFFSACGITLFGIGVNGVFHLSETGERYAALFFFMFFIRALSEIVLAYTRGVDQIAELSVSSVIASVVTIGCNIVFLVVFRWGLTGYFLANILGPLFQCLYLLSKSHMLGEIRLRQRYKHESEDMLRYSVPLITNVISWWINTSFDRYIILFFCGTAENGIYSVASKIPTILSTIRSVFERAWTLSAVTDFDPDDKSGFFSNTYKAYNCGMTVLCSAIIVSDKILAKFLYAKDFYAAWKYVPWLTIAVMFNALSGYIGGVFSATKASRMYASSTTIGAVLNIVLNMVMTPFIGALGAATSTTICYAVVWAFQLYHSKRYIKLNVNIKRDVITYFLLVAQSVIFLLLKEDIQLYTVEVSLFGIIFSLYLKDILELWLKVKYKIDE